MNSILRTSQTIGKNFLVAFVAFGFAIMPFASAASGAPTYTNQPLTQTEINDNWITDRAEPSGGYSSVSFASRSDVLEMNIDNTKAHATGGFYLTEGLKRTLPDGTTAIKAELYIDSDWSSKDVRAGLWGVGVDGSDDISAYPIMEFTTMGDSEYVGWRVFDDENGGWTQLASAPYTNDTWSTVEIRFDTDTTTFNVYINDTQYGSSVAVGSVDLKEVILNSYNSDTSDSADDYSAHWNAFAYGVVPAPVFNGNVSICHFENDDYTSENPNINGITNGHDEHGDDIIPPFY